MLAERQTLIGRTRDLLAQRRVQDAEQLLLDAQAREPRAADLLELLARFYEEVGRPDDAVRALQGCIDVEPGRASTYFALAEILERLGRIHDIVEVYTRLGAVRPELAIAHFNRAVYARRTGRVDDAVEGYRAALAAGIDGAAEAWSNLGVVLGELERHAEAHDAFAHALAVDPRWIPALYNLGLLHEEFGERDAAIEAFERVLAIDPDHHDAFVRIVHARIGRDDAAALADRVRVRLQRADLAAPAREALSFALGHALDAAARYDDAFAAYAAGNALARARARPYDRVANARDVEAITERFGVPWLASAPVASAAPLVFVCGMWRSGTTLLERMLGGHPALTPGGEIAYFGPSVVTADAAALRAFGEGYVALLERRFPGRRVIDKRPDNWRYLGLLHGLFPEAKFLVMRRDPRDTCLSIYFEQLDADQLPYATDLGDIAHQLGCCDAMLECWRTLLADRMLEVRYEDLVEQPRQTLERVCEWLGLGWDARMLDFATQRSRVRTASVWQVREAVHSRSIGRWRHYDSHLRAIADLLGPERIDER